MSKHTACIDDLTYAVNRVKQLEAINDDLLAALEELDRALTPHLEALRTSHLSMNRIEQAIYSSAIEAREASAKAKNTPVTGQGIQPASSD